MRTTLHVDFTDDKKKVIILDGEDISNKISDIVISASVGKPTTATITYAGVSVTGSPQNGAPLWEGSILGDTTPDDTTPDDTTPDDTTPDDTDAQG